MSYSYDRSKTAAKTPTLRKVMGGWLQGVAKVIAGEIPRGLKADNFRIQGGVGANYVLLEAKGYSRADMEATTSVSLTVDYQPFRLRAFAEYKDVMMGASRGTEREFVLDVDEDPSKMAKEIGQWLADR